MITKQDAKRGKVLHWVAWRRWILKLKKSLVALVAVFTYSKCKSIPPRVLGMCL